MSPDQVRQILLDTKTIAVVGMSTNPNRPSQDVPKYLKEHGYKIVPINLKADEILGEKAYPNLGAIPPEIHIDTVQVFLHSEDVPPVVEDAIKIGAKAIWM